MKLLSIQHGVSLLYLSQVLERTFPLCLVLVVHVTAETLPGLEHGGAELAGEPRVLYVKGLHVSGHISLQPVSRLKRPYLWHVLQHCSVVILAHKEFYFSRNPNKANPTRLICLKVIRLNRPRLVRYM